LPCLTGSFSSAGTVSLSDTEGNTYTCVSANGYSSGATDVLSNPAANNLPASTPFVSIWIAQNITGSSSLKITATVPNGATGMKASTPRAFNARVSQ
jgi:hypothetical protein